MRRCPVCLRRGRIFSPVELPSGVTASLRGYRFPPLGEHHQEARGLRVAEPRRPRARWARRRPPARLPSPAPSLPSPAPSLPPLPSDVVAALAHALADALLADLQGEPLTAPPLYNHCMTSTSSHPH